MALGPLTRTGRDQFRFREDWSDLREILLSRFDETELGFLPDSFGFVWTDGPALSSLGLQIVTESGIEFVPDPIAGLGDLGQNGSTLDDVFLGVVGTDRIRAVTVSHHLPKDHVTLPTIRGRSKELA